MQGLEEYKKDFYESLLILDKVKVSENICEYLKHFNKEEGVVNAIEKVVSPTLERIGREWESDLISLSQLYIISKLCEEIVDALLPESNVQRKATPKLAIAVFEDYHLLGKRLVRSALRSNGYDIVDYGHGVSVSELAERVNRDKPDILLISTLMLSSALHIKKFNSKFKNNRPRLFVGGAPFLFDSELWKEVGADAMGSSASDAINLVNRATGRQA